MVYRAKHVSQKDGSSLQWQNCRMAAGATHLDYRTNGAKTSTGAAMRKRQQDQSGGTDAYDLQRAWATYDEPLVIRNGKYWADLVADRDKGRWIGLDVWYAELPDRCQQNGNIGHTIGVAPETKDGLWLVSDPLCSGYKWMKPSDLRRAAEAWGKRTNIGTAINYTTATLEVSGTVGIFYSLTQWTAGKDIPVYLEASTSSKRVTTISKGTVFVSLGPRAAVDSNGYDSEWYSVRVKTGGLVPGSAPAEEALLWIRRDDMPASQNPTPESWDTGVWALLGNPQGVYPCPPSGDCPPCPDCPECPDCPDTADVIAARDAEWIANLTPPGTAAWSGEGT